MRVKFGNATKDVPLLEVTAENYIVPKGEEDTFHCRIEQIQFNRNNGKRESRPRIQKFEAKMYPTIARNLRQQGYTIDVLYDPTEFLKEREAKRKAEEKAALKAEILAELKEAGLLKPATKGGNKKGDKADAPTK